MIKIRISNEALGDLDDGFWFYDAQEAGLGDYFASQLRADIEGLKITAGIHTKRERFYHRILSHRFPYAIYYTFGGDEAVVWAVVDCRRNPEWIRKRLES
jgi:plasmid stabilization system protein ParE